MSSCSQWWGVLVDVGVCRAGGGCRIVGSIGTHVGLSSGSKPLEDVDTAFFDGHIQINVKAPLFLAILVLVLVVPC